MIAFFILYEVGLTLFYNWVKKTSLEMTTWVILGSKVVKLLLAALILILVHFLTDEPLVRFAFILLGVLIVSVIYESTYFLLSSKKKNEIHEKESF